MSIQLLLMLAVMTMQVLRSEPVDDKGMMNGDTEDHPCVYSMVAAHTNPMCSRASGFAPGGSQVHCFEGSSTWYNDEMHNDTLMTAAAASKCAGVHPQKQVKMSISECTGGKLPRWPMYYGLFTSEAPPA